MTDIKGYRELTPEEIGLINDVKEMGELMGKLIEDIGRIPSVDPRWHALARTQMQQGFMALVRSIAKPTGFA